MRYSYLQFAHTRVTPTNALYSGKCLVFQASPALHPFFRSCYTRHNRAQGQLTMRTGSVFSKPDHAHTLTAAGSRGLLVGRRTRLEWARLRMFARLAQPPRARWSSPAVEGSL